MISQALALAAIEDQDYARDTWHKVRSERSRLAEALRGFGFTLPDSQSNFVLATAPDGSSAQALYEQLKAQNILVRYFASEDRLGDKLRITVGTAEENQQLLAALDALL